MGKSYKVRYEKDEDGMWVAVIDRSQGVSCVAQGRSIGEAHKRIRGARNISRRCKGGCGGRTR
jgi:predicted RNase H-like HicB family nuclease